MSRFNRVLFCFFIVLGSTQIWAQTTTSPYSTFGIGEFYGNALANTQGMGGVGVAHPQGWYANNQNPALLIYNQLTVFHAGIVAEQRTIATDTASQSTKGGNLNYLVFAFPVVRNKWSTSLSLSPYTSVKYNLNYTENILNSTEKVDVIEKGSGGITQFSWSNGVRITEEITVGLKASYLFSSIVNSYQNTLQNSPQPRNLSAVIEETTYVKDFTFSGGFSFSKDSLFARQRYRFSIGAVYDFSTSIKAKHRGTQYNTDQLATQYNVDTLFTRNGSIKLPPGGAIGIALGRQKWTIGTEFSYHDWSKFRSVSADDEGLGKAMKASLGGEITPDAVSDNYLKRLTYRLGFTYEKYPYIDPQTNEAVRDIGATFGLSLPTGRSSLDIAFRYGQRGNANNYFQEDYFRVYFGITLNDQWFIRRRFD